MVTGLLLAVAILAFAGLAYQEVPMSTTQTITQQSILLQVATIPTTVDELSDSLTTTTYIIGVNAEYYEPNCWQLLCGGGFVYNTEYATGTTFNVIWSTRTTSYQLTSNYTATSLGTESSTSLVPASAALGLTDGLFTTLAVVVIGILALLTAFVVLKPRMALLLLLLVLVIAVATSLYLVYPSVGQVTSDVGVVSSTSPYAYTSFSTNTISSTITSCSLEANGHGSQQLCSYSTSQLQITNQSLGTQYSSIVYSSTTYQTYVVPPYTQFGLSSIEFVTLTALEFGILGGIMFLMLTRSSRRPPIKRSVDQRIPEPPPTRGQGVLVSRSVPVEEGRVSPLQKTTLQPAIHMQKKRSIWDWDKGISQLLAGIALVLVVAIGWYGQEYFYQLNYQQFPYLPSSPPSFTWWMQAGLVFGFFSIILGLWKMSK